MEHSFAHQAPEAVLFTTPIEAMRRKELFLHACDQGLILADEPTPTAEQLRLILTNHIVVQKNTRLRPVDRPRPLMSAHNEQAAEPLAEGNDIDDLMGRTASSTSEDYAKYNKFQKCTNIFTLRKMFAEEFSDSEHAEEIATDATKTKAVIMEAVKAELGLD